MMKNIETVFIAVIATCVLLICCNSPAKKVENAKEDLKEAKAERNQEQKDSISDYENFKAESEMMISNNERIILAYKEKMLTDKKQTKAKDQKIIDDLEMRNINMRRKVEQYKVEGKDKWSAFKVEFKHDMEELGKAIKNLNVKNTK